MASRVGGSASLYTVGGGPDALPVMQLPPTPTPVPAPEGSDPIFAERWQRDATFTPAMDAGTRDGLLASWDAAVARVRTGD